jgi:hypothetical protein
VASLIEDLLNIMTMEKDGYDRLYSLSEKKREAIVSQDLQRLEKIAGKEQKIGDELKSLENKRVRALRSMAVVLGHDNEELTVTSVIDLISKQPKEAAALTKARDELVRSANRMQVLNEQIQVLLKHAMEMVEFDMTLIKSMRGAPETGNYNRSAYNTGDILPGGGFDTKQ